VLGAYLLHPAGFAAWTSIVAGRRVMTLAGDAMAGYDDPVTVYGG
jgi:hypothetical protein